MTPLERSRFAAGLAQSAGAEGLEATPLVDSARAWMNSTRQAIVSGHGWTSGLFDCLLDFRSCFAACCCGPTVAGQLGEKVLKRRGMCLFFTFFMWICLVAKLFTAWYEAKCTLEPCADSDTLCREVVLDSGRFALRYDEKTNTNSLVPIYANYSVTVESYEACQDAGESYSSWWWYTAVALTWAWFFGMCLLTTFVRSKIRRRDNIPPTVMAGLDDCICATLCMPCVQAQIMRHEGMAKEKYHIFSQDGSREKAFMV